MAQFKTPLAQADDLIREARKDTLNNRINHKGNYENYITGGSHALDNQAEFNDKNNHAINIYRAKKGEVKNDYTNDPWIEGLNDRYTNPEHNERAGNAPYGSGLNYIHGHTPSTKRDRRANDIYFEAVKNKKAPEDPSDFGAKVGKFGNREWKLDDFMAKLNNVKDAEMARDIAAINAANFGLSEDEILSYFDSKYSGGK